MLGQINQSTAKQEVFGDSPNRTVAINITEQTGEETISRSLILQFVTIWNAQHPNKTASITGVEEQLRFFGRIPENTPINTLPIYIDRRAQDTVRHILEMLAQRPHDMTPLAKVKLDASRIREIIGDQNIGTIIQETRRQAGTNQDIVLALEELSHDIAVA